MIKRFLLVTLKKDVDIKNVQCYDMKVAEKNDRN